jgi:hypothetical protein
MIRSFARKPHPVAKIQAWTTAKVSVTRGVEEDA